MMYKCMIYIYIYFQQQWGDKDNMNCYYFYNRPSTLHMLPDWQIDAY